MSSRALSFLLSHHWRGTREKMCIFYIHAAKNGRLLLHDLFIIYTCVFASSLVLQLSAQSCPTLQHHGLFPTRSFCPWEFSRQENWSGLTFSPPGDLPDPGIKPASLPASALAGWFFTTEPPAKSNDHIQMWELDHKEVWAPKNWCVWIVELEKILESPLFCKEIKPVNPKGNQPWIFFGRTDAKAEITMLWPPDVKSQLVGKSLMLGKTEGKRRRGDRGWEVR